MKKILFYTNIPSPYRVNFFNELGKYCDLTVLFEIDSSTERDASWKNYRFENFHGIIMKGIRTHLDRAFCPEIIRYLKRDEYDEIVVCVLASATAMLAVTWMKFMRIPYCYEGDGAISNGKYGIKGALKSFIIKDAKLCFSTSESFDQYCRLYGAKDNVVRYPFTSINEEDIIDSVLSFKEKQQLRSTMGILGKHVLIGVGMIRWDKGWDILLSAMSVLKSDWYLYIIGGKITEDYERQMEDLRLNNIIFVDFADKEKLYRYYKCADVLCLPTRHDAWGLVVNEAMANGLPVITTRQCVAGLEMIEEGKNGFLYDCEDVYALKEILSKVNNLCEDGKLEEMGSYSLQVAKRYTVEAMVNAHLEAFG